MNAEVLARAYALIGEKTPLMNDCGALCGAACCQPDEDGQGGVYLFPGEENLTQFSRWGHVEETDFAPMLVCDGMCEREHRPFACRIFPLTPARNEKGEWTVRMDARARAMCPLVRSGVRGLNPEFVRAVRRAVRILAQDPEGAVFLERWAALEAQYRTLL